MSHKFIRKELKAELLERWFSLSFYHKLEEGVRRCCRSPPSFRIFKQLFNKNSGGKRNEQIYIYRIKDTKSLYSISDTVCPWKTTWLSGEENPDGNYKKVMAKYANLVVLILDEWLLLKPTNSEQRDIFELLHRRRKKSSTIFCSQYAFEEWYVQLGGGDSPLAYAIIDFIAHDSYRINITSIDAEHDRYMWLPMIGVL